MTRVEFMRLFTYDPDTGVFRWKVERRGGNRAVFVKARPGDVAGKASGTNGYVRIRTHKKSFYAHRLAWLFVYGKWPSQHIDHVNGVITDNRIANLRDVSRFINQQNRRRAAKHSKTGVLGVLELKTHFKARISIGGKTRAWGRFSTAAEAHQAYVTEKRRVHEGNTL